MAPTTDWVLLTRDTPDGVAAFATDALEASRAAVRAAAGFEPAVKREHGEEEKQKVQQLVSTPSTPRDRSGRRIPRRRPRTGDEKVQEDQWHSIQAQHKEDQDDRQLRAAAKAAWAEQFRKQLRAQGKKSEERAGKRQEDVDAEYTRAAGASKEKRKKAAAARQARRQHDLAALEAWRQRQTSVASKAVEIEKDEREKSEKQWKEVQAKRAARLKQRKNQTDIIKHRRQLGRLMRAADEAATDAAEGHTVLPQPGGRKESAAWEVSPNEQEARWKAVQKKVAVETRKVTDERMREQYKQRAARESRKGATKGSEWSRWPTCTDRARSSPQTG